MGLPMGFESNVMIYNKKILEENGLQVPKTTSELLETAKALQKHNGENSYGVALRGELGWGTIITAYQSLYKMWGATDFEVEGDKLVSKVNSPEAVEMTDWYVKLIQEGGSPTWASATWSSCGGELGAGTAAIMLDATNNAFSQTIPENAAEAKNLVIAPIPLPDGKTVNTPRQSSYDQAEYQELLKNSEGFVETFDATVDETKMYYTPETYFFEVSQTWCQTLQELVEGKYSSTQEGMDKLKEKLDEIVSHIEITE